jgi:hypothetical protein
LSKPNATLGRNKLWTAILTKCLQNKLKRSHHN